MQREAVSVKVGAVCEPQALKLLDLLKYRQMLHRSLRFFAGNTINMSLQGERERRNFVTNLINKHSSLSLVQISCDIFPKTFLQCVRSSISYYIEYKISINNVFTIFYV